MGAISSPKTLVTIYNYTLRQIYEECRYNLRFGRSLKPRRGEFLYNSELEVLKEVRRKVKYRGKLTRWRQVQFQEPVSGYRQYFLTTTLKMLLQFLDGIGE